MAQPLTVHMLIMTDSDNESERIVSLLRNAGYAVRPTLVQDQDELEQVLNMPGSWDLLLTLDQSPELDLDASQVLEVVMASERDLPVLIFSEQPDQAKRLDFIRQGAIELLPRIPFDFESKDLTPPDEFELLLLLIRRELLNLAARRFQKKAEASLRESEKRCSLLLESSRDPIAYLADGMHVYANQAYMQLFGYEDFDELSMIGILDLVTDTQQAELKTFLRDYQKGQGADSLNLSFAREDNRTFEASLKLSHAEYDGETCLQLVLHQTHVNPEVQKQLQVINSQDLVTGLFNRGHFTNLLDETINRAHQGQDHASLLYIEIDNYDTLKDQLGIAGTDMLLADLAVWFREQLGPDALLARFADDILTLLLPRIALHDAKELAEKLCRQVAEQLFDIRDRTCTTTISIGVLPIGENSPTTAELLARADKTCQRSRAKGGNRASVYNSAIDGNDSQADRQIVEQIQEAWEGGHLHLYYQPIVNLHGEPGLFYEVLLRITDEKGNEITADKFYPVAKQVGLSNKLDRWVIEQASRSLAIEKDKGRHITLFVILSADSIIDETLPFWIRDTLKTNRLSSDSFIFQINENDAQTHLKKAKQLSDNLQAMHLKLSISHFTPTSFPLLKHLTADFLKLSGKLTNNLLNDEESQNTLRTLVDSAHAEGKLTIMPQIEDATTVALLWQYEVNYIQGYYLAAPGPSLDYEFQDSI